MKEEGPDEMEEMHLRGTSILVFFFLHALFKILVLLLCFLQLLKYFYSSFNLLWHSWMVPDSSDCTF